MALFQPSHIIPSTLSGFGNGVVSADDNFAISWQVNGNSPMTGFDIQISKNNATSDVVSYFSVRADHGLPFYGTDQKGNSIPFVYSLDETWSDWGVRDGNEYKLKITQYWDDSEKSVVQYSESAFYAKTRPVLSITNIPATLDTVSAVFNGAYSQAQDDGINWVRWQLALVSGDDYIPVDDTGKINTAKLSYEYDGFLTGNTYAIMLTVETQSGVTASTGWQPFAVEYTEATASGSISLQYDPENECALLSWQKAAYIPAATITGVTKNDDGSISIATGGEVTWNQADEREMAFSAPYSAYWKGQVSAIAKLYSSVPSIYGESKKTSAVFTEDGQALYIGSDDGYVLAYKKSASDTYQFDSRFYSYLSSISAMAVSVNGEDLVVCGLTPTNIPRANVLNLSTKRIKAILSGSGQGIVNTATFCGSVLFLGWSASNGGAFYDPDYQPLQSIELSGEVYTCLWENNRLIVGGTFENHAEMFSVSYGETLSVTSLGPFYMEGTTLFDGAVRSITMNRGTTFACVCGDFTGGVRIYSHLAGTFSYLYPIPYAAGSALDSSWSLDATKLALVGSFGNSSALLYDINETESTLLGALPNSQVATTPLSGVSSVAKFSSDGKTLVICGDENGGAWLYRVSYPTINAVSFGENLSIRIQNGILYGVANGQTVKLPVSMDPRLYAALIGFVPGGITIYWLDYQSNLLSSDTRSISYVQPLISYVTLQGEQTNFATYIADRAVAFYEDYSPERGYEALFLTNYETEDFQAGILEGSSTETALYRLKDDGISLSPVYRFSSEINRIRDFSVRSNQRYMWEMFFVMKDNAYATPLSTETFCKQFSAFTLIEATEDPEFPDVYHALNVWRFANNISNWNVSNNNSPGMLQNFTKYPYRQPSSQLYKSGTLQCLLSNAKNGIYRDSAEQMELLFAISESTNTFFLRDIKGNLYMVHTNGPITQTMSTSSARNEVTISLPWVEVGDASNVSIIQTPLDDGWENNKVAMAAFNLQVETGILGVSYPENYSGTTFSGEGNLLKATTPVGMTPPSLEILDGNLIATE